MRASMPSLLFLGYLVLVSAILTGQPRLGSLANARDIKRQPRISYCILLIYCR
jgi:hypothetical protein